MDIKILSWESKGLRCPDGKVNLLKTPGNPYKISLIQMPNGTGKTTSLKLINACLTGSATSWPQREILALKDPESSSPNGYFKIDLVLDSKSVSFRIDFNFAPINPSVNYTTISEVSHGVVNGHHVDKKYKPFLKKQFLKLFIFDAEFAHDLLDVNKTDADKTIETMFQLDILDDLKHKVDQIYQDKIEVQASGGDAKTLQANLLSFKAQRDQVLSLKNELELLKSECDKKLKKELSEKEALLHQDAGVSKAIKEIDQKLVFSLSTLQSAKSICLERNRDPFILLESSFDGLAILRNSLDELKLPDATSREFFDKLLTMSTCICGNPLDDKAKTHLRNQKNSFLGEEITGVLNTLKSEIKKIELRDVEGAKGAYRELVKAWSSLDELKFEKMRLERGSDPEIQFKVSEYDVKIGGLKQEIDVHNQKLSRIDKSQKDCVADERNYNLDFLNSYIATLEKDLSVMTHTESLKSKKDKLIKALNTAKQNSLLALKQDIVKDINSRLSSIIASETLEVESIQKSIKIKNKEGASVGQTLSIAYSFITTLLDHGHHSFPWIVDSPAGSLDLKVRSEVGKILPTLCDQFITFIISSEREGFVSAMEESASREEFQFLTIFKKSDANNTMIESLDGKFLDTGNSIFVPGREFFFKFEVNIESGVANV